MPCAGSASETCGTAWMLSTYQFIASSNQTCAPADPSSSNSSSSTSSTTSTNGATSTPTTSPTTTLPSTTPSPTPTYAQYTDQSDESEWYSLGCATDSATRILSSADKQNDQSLTIDKCLSWCEDAGYAFAGVEYGQECYCGANIPTTITYNDNLCNMPCTGDNSEMCGGGWGLQLFELITPASSSCGASSSSSFSSGDLLADPTATNQAGGVGVTVGGDKPVLTTSATVKITSSTTKTTPATTKMTTTTNKATTTGKPTTTTTKSSTTTTHTSSTTTHTTSTTTTHTTSSTTHTTSTVPTTTKSSTTQTTSTANPSVAGTATTPESTSVAGGSGPKLVWAHFMVGNTYPYSQSNWASDISQAQSMGIDGFALNMGIDSWQPARIADAYAAAAGTGFQLFLSLDMTSLTCNSWSDAQSLVSLVKTYAGNSAQATFNGKTLVSTFSGESCTFGTGSTNGWQTSFVNALNSQGVQIFFMPSLFSDISTFSGTSWMDGELNWNSGWPMNDADLTTASDVSYMSALGSKEYMPAISPFFYTHFGPATWNKNWLYRSDDWLYCSRWEQVISMRGSVHMTEILTWNDYGESSYIGPIDGALPANSGDWVNNMGHTALAPLTQYYATAFKTGSYPAITEDKIVMWQRPHPHDAIATGDSSPQPTNWDWTDDNLYAVVMSTGPASVTLTAGSTSQTFAVQAGLTKLKIPSAPGGMGGSMVRSGQTVASYTSSGFTYTLTPTIYNFNYYVGSS